MYPRTQVLCRNVQIMVSYPSPTRRGGGVGILVKDSISIVRNKLSHLTHTTFEHMELLITAISIHNRLVVEIIS